MSNRKPLTEETKAKIRAAKLGKRLSPEHCAAISASQRGIKRGPMSEHNRVAVANGALKRWESLEERAKQGARLTGLKRSEATKEKMRASNRAYHEKRRAALATQETV